MLIRLGDMQVCSTQQWAILMVHAYPFFSGVESFFEGMFGNRAGEAGMQDVMAGACANPMHAEWRALEDYLCNITAAHAHDYKPIPKFSGSPPQAYSARSALVVSLHNMLL